MSYPMDEVQTLNHLAKQIHDNNIAKKFYAACADCDGRGYVDTNGTAIVGGIAKAPSPVRECAACRGIGSKFRAEEFYRKLCHVMGEAIEAFLLTRDHPIYELRRYEGRPGIVPIEGYNVDNPCVPAVPDKHLPGHPALAVEIADGIIRYLDLARWLGLDIGQAVVDKMQFNTSRPERHGKRH